MTKEELPETPAEPEDETLQELFVALTSRWRTEDGSLAAGVPRRRLLTALDLDEPALRPLLDRLSGHLGPLGLELIEYYHARDRWYAIKSLHAAPNELDENEQAVLGVVIALIEESKRPSEAKIPPSKLKRILVRGKYLTQYRLDKVLSNLEHLGYLRRTKGGHAYGPRTLIEYGEDSRRNIAEEARELVF